ARSAQDKAQLEFQVILGAEEIARGDLATALNVLPNTIIRVQPLDELRIPDSISDDVDQAMHRAFEQRPDLLAELAEIRVADARVKEARAAFYPNLSLRVTPSAQYLFLRQEGLPWAQTGAVFGRLGVSLNWTVFEGGARGGRLSQTVAEARAAEARVSVTHDQVANEVWTAYSNFNTALRQRAAAVAFLEAATKSYEAALESYNYGLRNLLDVTASQKTLAQ